MDSLTAWVARNPLLFEHDCMQRKTEQLPSPLFQRINEITAVFDECVRCSVQSGGAACGHRVDLWQP